MPWATWAGLTSRKSWELDETDYRGTFHVGKVGVEKYYEDLCTATWATRM